MASRADLVLENIYWKVAGLTPTSTKIGRLAFRPLDTIDVDPAQAAGLSRCFRVRWLGSEEEDQVGGEGLSGDLSDRFAEHSFEIEVYYSTKLKWRDLHDALLNDRHDLIKELRNPDRTFWSINDFYR